MPSGPLVIRIRSSKRWTRHVGQADSLQADCQSASVSVNFTKRRPIDNRPQAASLPHTATNACPSQKVSRKPICTWRGRFNVALTTPKSDETNDRCGRLNVGVFRKLNNSARY